MKGLLVASLVGNVLVLSMLAGGGMMWERGAWPELARQHMRGKAATPWQPSEAFSGATSIFALSPIRAGETVLAGDSQIVVCHWEEWFRDYPVRSRGIVGDGVRGLRHRLGSVVEGPPARLFFFAGGNDLYEGVPLPEVIREYRALLREVKQRSPTTQIFVLSTTPMRRNHYFHPLANRRARALNGALQNLATEEGVAYLDVAAPLTASDGALKTPYSYDGGHLNGAGCAAMASVLRPYVEG